MDYVGLSRALQGQALVYLDTVRPLRAESLLQEALLLIDGQQDKLERARVLDLLAENKLNRGELAEAEALWRQARELRNEGPGEGDLDARVRLRTGRLAEAREILEQRAAAERSGDWYSRNPRSHPETLLVLSLIYAFQGEPEQALASAEEGIRVGQLLASPFVEAVGYIRRGHALQLLDRPGALQDAEGSYRQALALAASLALPRLEVEGHWGLTRLYGFQGIDVGLRAGDEWIAALAGGLNALFFRNATPGVLGVGRTIDALLVTIIGGSGTLIGPALGAAVARLLGNYLADWFGPRWPFVFGIVYILLVMFFPYGLIGTWRLYAPRLKARWQKVRAGQSAPTAPR